MSLQSIPEFDLVDEDCKTKIDIEHYEPHEMRQAWEFIEPDDIVLELGCRIGAVSCTIAKKLNNPRNLVSVEPDQRAYSALLRNREKNNLDFQIFHGFISDVPLALRETGVWTYSFPDPSSKIPRCTLEELQKNTGCKFNVLVADCEGFLQQFYEENPWFFDQIRLIIFERDGVERTHYPKFEFAIATHGLCPIIGGFNSVWKRLE
jgi:FkbM family methyltransferase